MNIYIAARFSRRHEANQLANLLQELGHRITSRWVLPDSDHVVPTGMSDRAADSERRRFALEDVEDVENADCCISLMEEPRGNGRGGRHIEFGIAVALRQRLMIIGPRETVFHHLPRVEHFETCEQLVGLLRQEHMPRGEGFDSYAGENTVSRFRDGAATKQGETIGGCE